MFLCIAYFAWNVFFTSGISKNILSSAGMWHAVTQNVHQAWLLFSLCLSLILESLNVCKSEQSSYGQNITFNIFHTKSAFYKQK